MCQSIFNCDNVPADFFPYVRPVHRSQPRRQTINIDKLNCLIKGRAFVIRRELYINKSRVTEWHNDHAWRCEFGCTGCNFGESAVLHEFPNFLQSAEKCNLNVKSNNYFAKLLKRTFNCQKMLAWCKIIFSHLQDRKIELTNIAPISMINSTLINFSSLQGTSVSFSKGTVK